MFLPYRAAKLGSLAKPPLAAVRAQPKSVVLDPVRVRSSRSHGEPVRCCASAGMGRFRRPSAELMAKMKDNAEDRFKNETPVASPPQKSAVKSPSTRPNKILSREALRKAFDAFDADGSGHIDKEEMLQMIRKLKLNMSLPQIHRLVAESDPDGNGTIDFNEFEVVIRKQLRAGGNGVNLAGVVEEADSAFGWLNPLSWVGSDMNAPATSPSRRSRSQTAPLSSAARSKRRAASASTRSSTTATMRSQIPHMKRTQYAVGEANHQAAAEIREAAAVNRAWAEQQQASFLLGQHQKVLEGHKQTIIRVEAQEALALSKVQEGLQMRAQLAREAALAQRKERELVERTHGTVFVARKKKKNEVRARVQAEREEATAIHEAAKVARAERREHAKVTIKQQAKAVHKHTAKVRYETRPELRKEGADLFEARRHAVAEEGRQRAERERRYIHAQRQAYLQSVTDLRHQVLERRDASRQSREALVEARRVDAEHIRSQLEEARRRKEKSDEMLRNNTQALHDEVRTWKEESALATEEAEKSTWGWWV